MRKIAGSLIFSVLILFGFIKTSYALTINEVYPAPDADSNEWVELYNDTNDTVDLSGFVLSDSTGKHINFESTSITGNGFVTAISKNVLNNTGDTVNLKDINSNTIDTITYPSGLNDKKSYARCPDGKDGNFVTTEIITKNESNNSVCQNQSPTTPPPPSTNEPTSITMAATPTIAPTQPIYNNIYISEVMSYPKSGDYEWVELYNDNTFSVTLTNWHIDDAEASGSAPKTFSLFIAAKNYAVIDLTSAMFNNDGDSVRLLDENNILKDSISYSSAETDMTIGKTVLTSSTICLQTPTKGRENSECIKKDIATTTATTKSITPVGGSTTPLKTAIIITQSQAAKKTAKKNTNTESSGVNLTTSAFAPSVLTQPDTDGSVLGQATRLANHSNSSSYAIGLLKALSGSAYLIALLAVTLSTKRLIKKYRANYI